MLLFWAPHALKYILYNIGDLTPVPVVCKPDLVKRFGQVRSDYFQTHLLHSDMHDCFETIVIGLFVAQFEIQEDCEASNEQLRIHNLIPH